MNCVGPNCTVCGWLISVAALAGSVDEKEAPCIGGIEDDSANGLAVPSIALPAWLDL